MSKITIGCLVAALLIAGFAPRGLGAQSGKPATRAAVAPALESLTASDTILAQVARLRGLSILRPVPSGFKSREDIRTMVLKDLDETSKAEDYATSTALLKFLRLVGSDFELKRETTQLLTEQIAGFYEPKSRFFYLADWIPVEEQRAVIAHELAHALADQHFNLRRFEKWPDGDGDAKLAAHALVEGEATALMIQYSLSERGLPSDLAKIPVSLRDVLKSGVSEPDPQHPVFSNAPDVLKQSLQFPYVYGAGFVQSLVRDGAWRRVDSCYARLPASTEQIMHPEKYLRGEVPVRVTLPDVAARLGKGWHRADDDVSGEFGLFVLLKSTEGEGRAARAAAGWAGDRYGFYRDAAGERAAYVQRSVWDTDDDAIEFFAASVSRFDSIYGASAPGPVATVREWATPEGVVRLERRERSLLLVEGYRGTSIGSLVAALWKSAARPRR